MRGKACSAEFMRRIERLVVASEGQKRKDLVKFISQQTCISPPQIRRLIRVVELGKTIDIDRFPERPQPSVLMEALQAPDPVALAVQAVEEEWTVERVRVEAAKLNANNGHEPPPPPKGQFHTVVVDPPWAYGNVSGRHGPDYAPRMMTLEQIAAGQYAPNWNIRDHFADDFCHLYLWVTDAYLGDCYSIVRAWGFEPKASLVWVKDRIGMGNYYRHQHETCIFAARGRKRLKRMNASTVFEAKVGKHSEKPPAFYRMVESCSYKPFLDVFSRRPEWGVWNVFGDEVNEVEPQGVMEGV
jgi:N6-adenosine-specific RNA methylase IME4